MSVDGVLEQALRDGIYLYVDDSKLRYVAAKSALSPELKKKLEAFKEEIIDRLVRDAALAGSDSSALAEIPALDRRATASFPLSLGQQRLWFFHQYMGPNAVYNVPLALRLRGEVNEAALVRSLEELHRRHESLRTRFETRDGSAVQVIDPPGLELDVQEVLATEAHAIAASERSYQFDLSRDRLCRIRVLRETAGGRGDAGDYVLLVTMHHSVSDGWSLGVFFREFLSLYQAYANGEDSPLSPLPVQYADFAQWQRRWLQGEVIENQVSYWREKLKDLPPLLTLPTDRPRPAEQSFRGSTEAFALPLALSGKLQTLSREQGATLYMTLLSAFAVLLSRYSGQQDVAVGASIANRTRCETEGLIGFFVNTLVMRHDLSGDPRFIDLLQVTRDTALEAYGHQDVPFEQLVEELNPERSVSHSPLFQVAFGLVSAPFEAVDLQDLQVLPLAPDDGEQHRQSAPEGVARFDMTLNLQESAAGLVGGLEYNTDLFDRKTVRRMLEHYARLLEAIVNAPQARLSHLQMLGEEEKRLQLIEWNATTRGFPQEKCIHELFEEQARQKPDAVALVLDGRALTYGELNQRANQLARRLMEQGTGPEVRVGICMERSPELALGLLGILKAGGCYVPLDPEYPEARLEDMLAQSGCRVVLSERHLMMDLPLLSTLKVQLLDAGLHDAQFGAQGVTNVEVDDSGVSPDNLAYVIYTSGSTSHPKGNAVTHQNISRLIYNDFIDYAEARTILCAASPSFDAFTFELWGALLHGGCSVLAGASRASFAELGRIVSQHDVDTAWLTSSLFNQLIAESAESLKNLKRLLVGGEALSIEHVREGLRRLPQTQLINGYGPTENTTFSCTHAIQEAELVGRSSVPIGQPIGNTQAYVLGATGELVPTGVVGELYLGGAGLARGYLDRGALTAEKFVPNGFARTPGERLYRTGDLARWLPDATLEFLGRVDRQVKVRGYRIELGEIESVLLAHEAVCDAVVVALDDTSGSKRLVGYVVADAAAVVDDVALIHALRSRLLERLPVYMVPSALMVLPILPLTVNGKLDRQALPPPAVSAQKEYIAPEGPTEQLLAEIWCRLLKHDHVGRHDNFFDLGGHSLLAMQLAAHIREAFATELPLRELFEHPTLASQAASLARGTGVLADIPMEAVSREQPLPLSYAQQRLWFLQQYMGSNAVYNIPLALRLRGDVSESALLRCLTELDRRHESLRTRFETRDGSTVQLIDPPALVLEVEAVSPAEAQAIAGWERRHHFDLSRERLCRIRLLRETAGERGKRGDYVLLVTMHHTVSDGWSLGVFFRELVSLYRAYAKGEDSPLAPMPVQYADYAQWQRRWLQGAVLEEQVSYWREQLKDLPALLMLPTDRPRPAEQTFRGATEPFALPRTLSEKLQALSREQGVTLYMTLLSAFALLLGRYSGQQDVAVGTPIANRTRRETEGLIGFFVNMLVMRHDLTGDPRFVEVLKRTREVALQAYAHQDVPFEHLVEELNPQRSASHTPLFQVAFGLVNTPFEAMELPGLTVLPVAPDEREPGGEGAPAGTARFDMTLSVRESAAGVVGGLEYNTDLFDRSTIRRFLGHYTRLLDAIADEPQARLSHLQLLDEEEQRQQLVEWNARSGEFPRGKRVHELLEDQAERTPDSIALVHEGMAFTYREINERANRFAHYLLESGVVRGTTVAICVGSGADLATGVLGILKAGGAYVPLNPDDPAGRLAYLLEDSGAELTVTQACLCDEALQRYPSRNPEAVGSASDLACVRYEADEAGVSVGRMVPHAAMLEESMLRSVDPTEDWPASLLKRLTSTRQEMTAATDAETGVRGAAHYVLDRHGELLPVGAVGELHVGGEGPGWGYLHRSGLTAERFIPDAFSVLPGARLFRTEQRARWTANGKLELGGQGSASWLGHEKERREIEQALLCHEDLCEAAVLVAESPPRLVAYVVERAPRAMSAEQFIARLKGHLRAQPTFRRLPEEWMSLKSLPHTAAGTVDRSELPQPESPGQKLRYVAPRTEFERMLVEVWQQQLGLEQVGIEDNYFALGGDSIRSIALVAEARRRGALFSIKDLFAYPTVSALASAVERGDVRQDVVAEEKIEPFALLTGAERELLAQRHDMAVVEDAYPLSMIQQGMVLESLRHALLNVYLNFQIYEFRDAWDPQLFERALRHLLARHPMLRTMHDFSAERPLQLVMKAPVADVKVVDVQGLDNAAIQTALNQWMQSQQSTGLDTSVTLWRAAVHVLPGGRFLFGMHVHHALWDGWSLESFVTELYATYGLLKKEGRITERPPLPSYNQFIALEQAALSSQAHRSYWMRKLDGATVPWWTGREKSASAFVACEISDQASRTLSELARSLGVQEKSVWCSVYLTLLSLLSGTDEGLGSVITQGRPEIPDGDKMIGVFLNALPIRVAIAGKRWTELIATTDNLLREQHAFRQYPGAQIQRLTGLDFSAAMFNYSNWHVYYEGIDRQGTKEDWVPKKVGGWQETNHLLTVFVHKDDKTQCFSVGIGADSQVFDAAFRERIAGYTASIVEAIAGDAAALIDKTKLLGDEERRLQLLDWNATSRGFPQENCIHELFEAHAAKTPDLIAVVHEGGELTFGELNRRANQLARRLMEQGVGPEVRVGLCTSRSAEMVIGIMGILKAGGAYVPLDPRYPRKRLEYLLEDSAVELIVTDQAAGGSPNLGSPGAERIYIRVDAGAEADGAHRIPGHNPVTTVNSANLGYVIYTSGSTGQPKGVAITHRSAVSLLSWSAAQWSESERAGVLASTSICFDLSIYELFVPLTQGGQCVLIDSILGLSELPQRERVSLVNTVPSAARALLEQGGLPRSLRVMNLAGEPLKAELVDALYEFSSADQVYDLYGPSESTTYSTFALRSAKGPETIGRPVANTQAYVLDGTGALLPGGVVGELYLGGVGLARGYLNRPGPTAEKFVPNNFAQAPGERLYRTGDLARWLPDGTLEFLGRMDHQVKVRGYRIELGEIESVLRAHEAVRDAVVVARDEAGSKRLVGYVAAGTGAQADEAALLQDLRSRLQEQLPGYMVPSVLMVLESLPLTANGKLDRKALPAPVGEACTHRPYEAPQNPTELLLAQLWCSLLKRERVGRHDNFFELGGHSLLALQLATRIRQAFEIEIAVTAVFQNGGLKELASFIAREVDLARLDSEAIDSLSEEEAAEMLKKLTQAPEVPGGR